MRPPHNPCQTLWTPVGAPLWAPSGLFSQREKIEMRGRFATTKGNRSPPTLAVSHPVYAKVPVGAIHESPSQEVGP